jgi:hypothetical protein
MNKACGPIALVLAALVACVTTSHAREKVRVAYAVQIHQANMMLLQEYGQKHGVDVELTPMRHYTNLQLALTTNQVDIAAMGYVNIGLMEELGFRNFKVIAGVFTGAQSLTLRTGVTANTWKDLEGKAIGVAPNSYADILFRSSAKLGGADLTKIKFVSFGPGGPQVIAALRNADIDGFVFWEPNNAEAVLSKAGYYSSLDLGKNPTRHINGMMAVNADFAAGDRRPDGRSGALRADRAAGYRGCRRSRQRVASSRRNGLSAISEGSQGPPAHDPRSWRDEDGHVGSHRPSFRLRVPDGGDPQIQDGAWRRVSDVGRGLERNRRR